MTEPFEAGVVLLVLLGSSALGLIVQPYLSEHHRSRESMELVRLVVAMLVTFTALVLGMLTTSVKSSFDKADSGMKGFAAELIQLDESLRQYGGEAASAREQLRNYTAAVIASIWFEEVTPPSNYYPKGLPHGMSESLVLGDKLNQVGLMIRQLEPQDAMHRQLVADCIQRFNRVTERRWQLIEDAGGVISVPFASVVILWLAIVFASFGLNAPRNTLVCVTISIAAVSIASVIYLILDLDSPFTGVIAVSSHAMRGALAHLSR
jgi:fumarate reductase subunit D